MLSNNIYLQIKNKIGEIFMKRCKNCGAKMPKGTDVCKKCGKTYEYIDLDPESKELITVVKPSNMLHICILILSVIIFLYSLLLIYLNFTNKKVPKTQPQSSSSSSSIADSVTDSSAEDKIKSDYFAVDLIGKTLKDLKDKFGEQYTIKMADTTLITYVNYPLTFSTLDKTLTDESVISSITVTDAGFITPEVTADMTYFQLSSALNFAKPSPVLNETDSYYYAYRVFENDNYIIQASFKFDDDSIDKSPLSVKLDCEQLTAPNNLGTVTGDTLSIRTDTFYDADVLHQLVKGDIVEILETVVTDDDTIKWFKVSFNNMVGYCVADYIQPNQ